MNGMASGTGGMNSLKNWISKLWEAPPSQNQRRAKRLTLLPLIAYYWDGTKPMGHGIRDMNALGLYLLTDQRWYPGSLIMMTLQRTECAVNDPDRSIAVLAKVVRVGEDGVGFQFAPREKYPSGQDQNTERQGADQETISRFIEQLLKDKGQALLEYVLVLPLLFLLIVNLVNFGGFLFAWITVANAARAGTDYAILGGASVGSLPQATAAQVNNLITQDISSLPNRSSLVVNICQNNSGTITTRLGTCSSIPADPEPTNFILTTIDVSYTFQPFIPAGFQFRNLNITATIPPTTVHRRAVMRTIQ